MLPITAEVSDDVALAQVQILVGGKVICSLAVGPFRCDWRVPAMRGGGVLAIHARAVGASGYL